MRSIHALYHRLLKLPAFRGKSRLENAIRELLHDPVTVLPDGLKLALDPNEWLQIELAQSGQLEPLTTQLIVGLLNCGDTFLDVGSHVGYLALTAARKVGPTGRVIAIDPQPYNCDRLMTNAALNGVEEIVKLYVAAVAGYDGDVTLNNQGARDKARLTLALAGVNDTRQRFVVPVKRLDTIAELEGLKAIRLLKIDVEGLELDVLRGASGTLPRVENIVLEVLPDAELKTTSKLVKLLTEAGFTLHSVTGAPWVEGQHLPESNLWARRY